MQTKKILSLVVVWISLVAGAQGAAITALDWQFATSANPSSFAVAGLPEATATATITRGSKGYGWFSTTTIDYDWVLAGNATGFWHTGNGQFELGLNRLATSGTLSYSLQIDQYIGFGIDTWAYPGTVSFSVPNGVFVSREALGGLGTTQGESGWYRDIYTWNNITVPDQVSMTITPSGANGTLIVDRLQFNIDGPLSVVPEPVVTQSVAAAGLMLFGFWWRRRKA